MITPPPQLNNLTHQLIEQVHTALIAAETPGASIALLLDDQPIVVSGVGFRDLDRTAALDASAPLYIYSVTKTLIATVILQLVEQTALDLDTPITSYLAELPLPPSITVRRLLNHTGGVPDYGGLAAYSAALTADPTQPWTAAEFLARTLPSGPVFPPGEGWRYSNIGFLLLRLLIERHTQRSLHAVLHERIFVPLGLQHTFVAESLADASALTPGYSTELSSDGALIDIRPLYHPGWVSHGVVVSTALELARILDAVFAGRLLRASSRAAMFEAVPVPIEHPFFQQPAYGLGVMIDRQSRHGVIVGHGGGGPGYVAGALHLPNAHGRRITSVVLANRDHHDLALRTAFTLATTLADALAT